MALAQRLTNTGVLQTAGEIDEYSSNGNTPVYSVQFNGTTQYLTVAYDPSLQITSQNFTIEFWVYFTSVTGNVLGQYNSYSNLSYSFYVVGSSLCVFLSSTGTTWNIADAVAIGTVTTNTWYHIALTRNGTTIYPFLNGSLSGGFIY